jgi:glycine/D-amino acid oxidase-like deaminating enzyme
MGPEGTAVSYWMDSTGPTSYPALAGDLDVDVAVVGGGIAGLCTAWELVRAGRSVAVLEADRVAAGVTGHTTAKLTALHTLIYAEISALAGAEAARLYGRSQQDAVEHVARTAAELGIDCELERRAAYTYVESAERVEAVRAEAEAAAAAGLPASFVAHTGLPFPVAGAVRVENQAQLHPRRYLLALAAAIACSRPRRRSPPTSSATASGRPGWTTSPRAAPPSCASTASAARCTATGPAPCTRSRRPAPT